MVVDARSQHVRVPKAGELVAGQLRRQIVTGELQPGDPLPSETSLMETFGVSRPTLREAFRILESESIIRVLRGAHGGARVLAPSAEVAANFTGLLLQYQGTPLVDVYRARASIEVSVLVELVGRGAAKRLDALQAEIDKGADLIGDAVQFARWDARMHSMIVELGENKALTVIASMLFHIVSRHNEQFVASHESEQARPAHRAAHRAYSKLVKLLREGDVPAAQSFWRKHLDGVEKYMVGSSDTTLVEILS